MLPTDTLSCFWPPPRDKEKPWDAFFKSGRSPQIANRSRVRRSLLAWHSRRRLNKTKRNRTKRNETIQDDIPVNCLLPDKTNSRRYLVMDN